MRQHLHRLRITGDQHKAPVQDPREMIWYTQLGVLRKRDEADERKANEKPWAEQQKPKSRSRV